jgi:phosphoenolpyruvate carboxylase
MKRPNASLLMGLLGMTPAPCGDGHHDYSAHTQRTGHFRGRQGMRERFGAQAIRHYIISHTETVSDLLEVLLLQKEVGLMRGILNDRVRATTPSRTQRI